MFCIQSLDANKEDADNIAQPDFRLIGIIIDKKMFTIQSCIILFQSSPVTIRNSTVMALPAEEKFACLI